MSPAFVMQVAGALEVKVRVPETMIRDVDFGQTVRVEFPSMADVTVAGVIATIGAESESGNAFPVTIRLAATDVDVRPGMTASVTFNFSAYLDGRIAYLIPISAIAIDAGLRRAGPAGLPESKSSAEAPVFVFDPTKGQVNLRQVVVGDLRGNELEVFDGLAPGDQVISAGVAFVRDGMKALAWQPSRANSQ